MLIWILLAAREEVINANAIKQRTGIIGVSFTKVDRVLTLQLHTASSVSRDSNDCPSIHNVMYTLVIKLISDVVSRRRLFMIARIYQLPNYTAATGRIVI